MPSEKREYGPVRGAHRVRYFAVKNISRWRGARNALWRTARCSLLLIFSPLNCRLIHSSNFAWRARSRSKVSVDSEMRFLNNQKVTDLVEMKTC